MITSAESFRVHTAAWNDPDGDSALRDLATQIRETISAGRGDDAIVINHAAALLDLHQNRAALNWLLEHHLGYREYFANLATAYVKLDHTDLRNIRKNNQEASRHPSCQNAVLAYIDYQGL